VRCWSSESPVARSFNLASDGHPCACADGATGWGDRSARRVADSIQGAPRSHHVPTGNGAAGGGELEAGTGGCRERDVNADGTGNAGVTADGTADPSTNRRRAHPRFARLGWGSRDLEGQIPRGLRGPPVT
jgi:hypothetical protein